MQAFTSKAYHKILCADYPDFLDEYINLPVMQRLAGVGLLCGTDWTPLFHNQFYYSRLDHSIGTALITWNFTKNKKQTLASLMHDISTPAFSHVIDFKNGDRMRQESTESQTSIIINDDPDLTELLFRDGIYKHEIDNYHIYPICDNQIPRLSADRLEYMYPSAAALDGTWDLDSIKENYSDIMILKNEEGKPELGFAHVEAAVEYTKKFLKIGILLQQNEDKIAMQLLADVTNLALKYGCITENELYNMDEVSLISRFEEYTDLNGEKDFQRLFRTYRNMTKIEHTNEPLPNCYSVSFNVKKRYMDPLVKMIHCDAARVSDISKEGFLAIHDFLVYQDTPYGCVPYIE